MNNDKDPKRLEDIIIKKLKQIPVGMPFMDLADLCGCDDVDKRKYLDVKLRELLEQHIIIEDGLRWYKLLTNGTNINEISPEQPPKEIHLPGNNKLVSEFAQEVVELMKGSNLFFKTDSREVVEIGLIKIDDEKNEFYSGFAEVKPARFVTLVEKYFVPVRWVKEGQDFVLKKHSLGVEVAHQVLCSDIFQNALPKINRIFSIPIPILYHDELTFPKKGYDKRFNSWLSYDSPDIYDQHLPIEEAKSIIEFVFSEFCFETDQDKHNAIAALLTPFIRGLFTSFNVRTPVFFYLGNRERCGKDYLAGITGIVYEGFASEEAPLCSGEKGNNNEELRKKMMSAMMHGRKRLHFSNNKGYINNSVFESVITAATYSDRVLGKNDILTFSNELDFSLSGNTGITFSSDLANRCRFIKMFLEIEDANARTFSNPNLHLWVLNNRSKILSAMFSLVRNWIDKGKPAGSMPFASFPEWANICGGIMEAAGYLNPCKLEARVDMYGDSETQDMKQLFELCYERFREKYITKRDIRDLLEEDNVVLFSWIDWNKKSDQTKFALRFNKFVGRILSDIKLVIEDKTVRGSRQKYMFTKEFVNLGNVGNVGNVHLLGEKLKNENNIINIHDSNGYQTLPRCPDIQPQEEQPPTPNRDNNNVVMDISSYREHILAFTRSECNFEELLTKFGDPDEAERIIRKMVREGVLFEPRLGWLKRL